LSFFFFSSRRRHTRWPRDWSSDVCSSDLGLEKALNNKHGGVVLVGDFLYGDTNDAGTPFCAELMTGKIRWKARPEEGASRQNSEIGRASCRERVEIREGGGAMKEKRWMEV